MKSLCLSLMILSLFPICLKADNSLFPSRKSMNSEVRIGGGIYGGYLTDPLDTGFVVYTEDISADFPEEYKKGKKRSIDSSGNEYFLEFVFSDPESIFSYFLSYNRFEKNNSSLGNDDDTTSLSGTGLYLGISTRIGSEFFGIEPMIGMGLCSYSITRDIEFTLLDVKYSNAVENTGVGVSFYNALNVYFRFNSFSIYPGFIMQTAASHDNGYFITGGVMISAGMTL